jgi:hypothetical protein
MKDGSESLVLGSDVEEALHNILPKVDRSREGATVLRFVSGIEHGRAC